MAVRKIDNYLTVGKALKISNSNNKLQWLFGIFGFSFIPVPDTVVAQLKTVNFRISRYGDWMSGV